MRFGCETTSDILSLPLGEQAAPDEQQREYQSQDYNQAELPENPSNGRNGHHAPRLGDDPKDDPTIIASTYPMVVRHQSKSRK